MTEQNLIELIEKHKKLYWNGESEISDAEYDKLIEQLKIINPNNNILNNIETNINSELEKVKHDKLMLSLNKAYTFQSVLDWALKNCRNRHEELLITPKYDGVSARFYKNKNILATRGDGLYGENITDKMLNISFITNKDESDFINGEIIIKNSEFEKIKNTVFKKDGSSYTNSRNFVGGFLNSKEINTLVKLDFIQHDYFSCSVMLKDFDEQFWKISVKSLLDKILDYTTDGIVVEIKDKNYSESLGYTSHHPKGKIAFKFETEYKYTTIKDVHFSPGKRKLTPVALLEPITINNVTIKRVSLHNSKMLIDNDVHINDIVKIVRSGDVIPYVAEFKKNDSNRRKIFINECPSCGGPIKYVEPDLYCVNKNCEGSNAKQLHQCVQILGIDNIGITTIESMIEVLEIKTIQDILELTEVELQYIPGFGDRMVEKIFNNIQSVKSNPIEDYKLLACLNIKGVGETICKSVLENITLDQLLNSSNILENSYGIGEIRATEIHNAIIDNYHILDYLIKTFNYKNTKTRKKKVIKGTICFTGKFDNNKITYYDKAKLAGYEISEDVTQYITYVVAAGPNTSKSSKARKYGIPILNIDEFFKLINI